MSIGSKSELWILPVAIVVVGLATGYAFRPELAGTLEFWVSLTLAYVSLACLAAFKLYRAGVLGARLSFKAGDVTWGILSALALLVASWVGRATLAPAGTAAQAWLFRIYLQIGDADSLQRSFVYTFIILLLSVSEELVWRGAVLDATRERLSPRWANPAVAAMYALAHAPTLFLLRDPVAGLNPLLVLLALGAGLCWGFMAQIFGRLPPVIISHMVFSYFSAVQFRLPGL